MDQSAVSLQSPMRQAPRCRKKITLGRRPAPKLVEASVGPLACIVNVLVAGENNPDSRVARQRGECRPRGVIDAEPETWLVGMMHEQDAELAAVIWAKAHPE